MPGLLQRFELRMRKRPFRAATDRPPWSGRVHLDEGRGQNPEHYTEGLLAFYGMKPIAHRPDRKDCSSIRNFEP